MSIKPPSDLILDVARNADSSLEAAATRRLEALASAGSANSESFTSALDRLGASKQPSVRTVGVGLAFRGQSFKVGAKTEDRTTQVAQEFEASLLGSLVNEMMPKEALNVYGQGVAGDVYKSMLAEQVGRQLAKSGALGLARRLFATHPIEDLHGPASAQSAGPAQRAAQASAQPLSMSTRVAGGNFAGGRRS